MLNTSNFSTPAEYRVRRVWDARNARNLAEQNFREAILTAYRLKGEDEGYTVSEIAEAAGITRERVHQIVREASA